MNLTERALFERRFPKAAAAMKLAEEEKNKIAEERAEQAARDRREHAFQVKLAVFSNALSFVLGILATLLVQWLAGHG